MSRGDWASEKKRHPLWKRIEKSLRNADWIGKGLLGNCPSCGAESTSSKAVFLIFFDGARFKAYSCFKCNLHGSGGGGVRRLCDLLGIETSFLEANEAASGSTSAFDIFATGEGRDDDSSDEGEGDGRAIEWPPPWAAADDEVVSRAVSWMRDERRIPNPEELIEIHDLVVTGRILAKTPHGIDIIDYPSILFPWVNGRMTPVGWSARYIGEPPSELPKAMTLPGKKWQRASMFGLPALDPSYPVTIVEGGFSSLSTPNSCAAGGKLLSADHIAILGDLGASVYIFGNDPDADHKTFADNKFKLAMESDALILHIKWDQFIGNKFADPFEKGIHADPNDRGYEAMSYIIRETVRRRVGRGE